jgi:hypothetical protein
MLLQATLHGHTDFICDLQTSPCGKFIVSTSNDGKAIVWDLYKAQMCDKLDQHESSINNATFAQLYLKPAQRQTDQQPQRKKAVTALLTCSDDGKIMLYDQDGFLHN